MAGVAIEDALEPLRAMLAADGYSLTSGRSGDGTKLLIEVLSTPRACAECLVPANVIASVARGCLADADLKQDVEIEVRLPDGC